jgi:hypothetical protein
MDRATRFLQEQEVPVIERADHVLHSGETLDAAAESVGRAWRSGGLLGATGLLQRKLASVPE